MFTKATPQPEPTIRVEVSAGTWQRGTHNMDPKAANGGYSG
jgi:hypothetical protein